VFLGFHLFLSEVNTWNNSRKGGFPGASPK